MNLMGIDMGTTSVKTAVFDEKLNQKMQTTADYTLESKGDRVEFESEKYWEIVSGEIEKIKESQLERLEAISGYTVEEAKEALLKLVKQVKA